MEELYSFFSNNIEDEEYVVVGVSGGVDSMVLISLLNNKTKSKIVCAHVHHNLREESDEELEFVKEYCTNNGIIFEFTKLEYENKFNEKTAREMRYSFFERILNKYNSKILLTAHHGDDLIETILMRLVRGSTLKGYSGIEMISERISYKILRPLLFTSKEEIYKYAKTFNVPFREDMTNTKDDYTRNRYRKYILPFIKEENSQAHLKFLDYSNELLENYYFIDKIIDNEYERVVINNKINIEDFNLLETFIKKSILKKYLFNIYNNDIEKINTTHVTILLDFILNGDTNTSLDLPNNYKAFKEYETLSIKENIIEAEYSFIFDKKIDLPNNKTIEQVNESDDTSNFITYLNSSMIEFPLIVRTYRPGDRMSIKNMEGHKKISDIFTDEKVNSNDRLLWPIIVDNTGEVIWIPGLKKSHFDRKKDEKYDIILRYY